MGGMRGPVHLRHLDRLNSLLPDGPSDLLRPIRFVPETTPANKLLELFIADRAHMFAVIDEYGGVEGVVTLEDVLECLLGAEIVDEHDQVEDMQVLALERAQRRRAEQEQKDPPEEPQEPAP